MFSAENKLVNWPFRFFSQASGQLGFSLCLMLKAAVASGAESLPVTYPEKPPYYYTESGVARGELIELAQRIFATAGLPVRFTSRPAPRALSEVAETNVAICSLGWFKNPDRERFARFSQPIFRDLPMQVLIRTDRAGDFSRFSSLEKLLAAPDLKIGVVAGFSYGVRQDEQLRRAGERVAAKVNRVEQLFEMVRFGRVDLALVNEMEYSYFTRQSPSSPPGLQILAFPDVPSGNLRHLMCSRAVPPATMERIDAAILQLGIGLK